MGLADFDAVFAELRWLLSQGESIVDRVHRYQRAVLEFRLTFV